MSAPSLAPDPLSAEVAGARAPALGAAVLLPALLALALVLFAPQVFNDGDTYWHVAAGNWMLDHHQVARADPFSFTFAGRPWHAHEWLAEIAMALAWRAAGWAGVAVLCALAAAAALALLARGFNRRLDPLGAAVALILVAGCLSPSLIARPHLLMLPLLAAWTLALLDARALDRAPGRGWWLLILVWANLHASVILALALIGPFALEALIAPDADRWRVARQWGLFGIGALAAALITPFGVAGLLFPLQVSGMASLNSIVEWRPPDFQHPQPLEAALLAGVFILARGGVSLPVMRLGLLLVLIHLALGHTRHQVLLAVIGGLIVAEAVGGAPRFGRAAGKAPVAVPLLAAVLAIVLIGARLAAPIVRRDGPVSPISALAHVPPDLRARPVLNGYGMGGYLIFQGVRPFIDGRTDMYGDAFNARYDAAMAADAPALQAVLNDDRIAWTILDPDAPAVKALDSDPGWRRLYAAQFAVIHVRATATLSGP
jgi:hypothetical protein